MLSAGSWAWAYGVSLLACPSQASPNLKWQEWREAGFTEQRSLSASNGGRITGCCTMSPIQAQGLTIANHHFFLALLLTSLSCFQTKEAHKDTNVSEDFYLKSWTPQPSTRLTMTTEEAMANTRRLAKERGPACGHFFRSKPGSLLEDKGKMIVTVFPSGGERYMDSDFFADVRGECIAMTF
uniref:Uncharacterized protein n=1 Tax=Saccharum spontaneum TaxID=62335 RepID=A0A678TQC9_SACSP|nr:hypothetical protein SS32B07_000014 [Saccharum spontaneum]